MFYERCLKLQARLILRKKGLQKVNSLRVVSFSSSTFFFLITSILIISVRSQCGGDLTTESGVITSPRFPSSYPDDANCEWKIAVDDGSRITLTSVMFEVRSTWLSITRTENSNTCGNGFKTA